MTLGVETNWRLPVNKKSMSGRQLIVLSILNDKQCVWKLQSHGYSKILVTCNLEIYTVIQGLNSKTL